MAEELDMDTVTHETEGSITAGWPAVLIAIGILSAALYSFSPRPDPPFPETVVRPDGLLVNDLARQGARLVAVGELGRILLADDPAGPWREARVEPQRGSSFTRVGFIDDGVALAVGHDSWIVRSEDGGQNWQEVLFEPERSEPLMGLAGPIDGVLYAYGAFGQFQISADLGKSWTRDTIVVAKEAREAGAIDPATDPKSPLYNPFAAFGAGSMDDDFTTRHMNFLAQVQDGSLFLVGERGLIARSTDGGASFRKLDEIYSGSFYGVLAIGESTVVVHGMRGHAFRSEDFGDSWTRIPLPSDESLFGGRVNAKGEVYLSGANNTVLRSTDGAKTFTKISVKDRNAVVTVVPLGGGKILTAGEGGILLQDVHIMGDPS